MKKKSIFLLSILIILSLLLSACTSTKTPDQTTDGAEEDVEEAAKKDNIGRIDGVSLDGVEINNDIISENDLTMLNIWATFCPPCIEEMPDLGEINREFTEEGKNFSIIGVTTDVGDMEGNIDEDSLELANEIIDLTAADYLHIIPGDEFIKSYLYKVSVIPTTVFVNKEGDILKTVVGAKSKVEWLDIIEEIMADL